MADDLYTKIATSRKLAASKAARPAARAGGSALDNLKFGGTTSSDQKAIDFFLSKDEQLAEKAKASSTVEDILDVIDNINRPFYAVTGGLKEIVHSFKDNDPLSKDVVDVGKAMIKGFTREERNYSRDILREISPDLVDSIERSTKFHLFGADILEMDALSVLLFPVDIALDPTTFIKVGQVTRAVKGTSRVAGKGLKAASEAVIGEARVAKILEASEQFVQDKILPLVDVRKQFENVPVNTKVFERVPKNKNLLRKVITQKPTSEIIDSFDDIYKPIDRSKLLANGKADVSNAILTFQRSKDIAESNAALTGVEVSRLAETHKFFGKVNELMTEADSINVGQAMSKADDLGEKALMGIKARKLGVAVEDIGAYNKFEDLISDLGLAEGKAEEQAILKEINKAMGELKNKNSKLMVSKLLEQKGLKTLSNEIVRGQTDAIKAFAKNRKSTAYKLYRESISTVDAEISNIQKTLKSGAKLTFNMVESDVSDAVKSINGMRDAFKATASDAAVDLPKAMKESLDTIKRKVQGLTKYQADVTSGLQKLGKSQAPLRRINTLIRNLELDIGKQQIGEITKIGGMSRKEIITTLNSLNKELKVFEKASKADLLSIKSSVKAGKQLTIEIITDYKNKLAKLLKDRAAIEKDFKAESVMYEVAVRKADKHYAKASKKMYGIVSKLNSKKFGQEVMQEMWGQRTAIFESAIKDLPSELKDVAWKARKIFDDYALKLSEGPDPLLRGINPLYFPRTVQKEYMEEVFNTLSKYQGTGRSMLRKRGFETTEQFAKYIESKGGKVEMDAAIVLMDYMKKADMAMAKRALENEILAKTGYKSLKDLPIKFQKSLDYLYRGGHIQLNNPVLEALSDGYSSLLNKTKAALTVINPMFHGRNILGFPFLAMSTAGMKAGLNPLNYSDAFMIKMGSEGALKIGGKTFTYKAIREAAEKSGYFGAAFTRGDIRKSANVLLKRYPKNSIRRFIGEAMKLSMHSEDLGRYGALVANLRSGMSMETALEAARKAMFDYNLINSPIDKAFQGILGFYTFSRRNLPQQLLTVLDDPKQYAITARILNKISNRESLSDEEVGALSNYEKETFKVFGEAIDGVREFMTLGFFPVEEAYQTLNTMRSGEITRILGSKINPVLGPFLDWYYGKNSFYGGDIGNYLPAKYERVIPAKLQKALGLTVREKDKWRGGEKVGKEKVLYGDPDVIFAIRQFPLTSRFFGSLVDLADSFSQGKGGKGLVRFTTGMRTSELNLEQRKMAKNRREHEALVKKAKTKGGKTFDRLYVPKTYKQNPFESVRNKK